MNLPTKTRSSDAEETRQNGFNSGDHPESDSNEHDRESEGSDKDERGGNTNSHQAGASRKKGTSSSSRRSFFSVGDSEYSEENWKVEPMHLSKLAGDFYFDFTKAFIPERKTPISIKSLAGDVRILIPKNIAFRLEADVKAGDINVFGEVMDGINRSLSFETENYDGATKKLDFSLRLKAGSIRIDQV